MHCKKLQTLILRCFFSKGLFESLLQNYLSSWAPWLFHVFIIFLLLLYPFNNNRRLQPSDNISIRRTEIVAFFSRNRKWLQRWFMPAKLLPHCIGPSTKVHARASWSSCGRCGQDHRPCDVDRTSRRPGVGMGMQRAQGCTTATTARPSSIEHSAQWLPLSA